MSSSGNWKVTVLCPSGHRVTVKVTQETPVLFIVEEACRKRELVPSRHGIRHHKTVLDLSLSVRYANLPNNAQLELFELDEDASSVKHGPVRVAVQMEGGQRLVASYPPETKLSRIVTESLKDASIPACKDGHEEVMVYMRREVVGRDKLSSTTLRDLGMTSGGSGVIRFFYRDRKALKDQAGTYIAPSSSSAAKVTGSDPMETDEEKAGPQKSRLKRYRDITLSDIVEPAPATIPDARIYPMSTSEEELSVVEPDSCQPEPPRSVGKEEVKEAMPSNNLQPSEVLSPPPDAVINFIGETNNAVAFRIGEPHLNSISSFHLISDDFFELGLDDVKLIHRDNQLKLKELEDGEPLLTKDMRGAQESGKKLLALHTYKKCILRIQFPKDGLVLQGIFLPAQTLEEVKEFVRKFLRDPRMSFSLYTTPPKKVLEPSETLLDLDFVPSSLVHFELKERGGSFENVLKEHIPLSNGPGVERVCREANIRRKVPAADRNGNEGLGEPMKRRGSADMKKQGPEDKKIPKWFKSNR